MTSGQVPEKFTNWWRTEATSEERRQLRESCETDSPPSGHLVNVLGRRGIFLVAGASFSGHGAGDLTLPVEICEIIEADSGPEADAE